jgi:predicted glutamine amidotransferase
MCRLFGMSAGAHHAGATFWLLEAPDSLSEQSRREPDGTGLGWFGDDGRPQVDKRPVAAYEDRAFAEDARERRSRTFVAHVRRRRRRPYPRASSRPGDARPGGRG